MEDKDKKIKIISGDAQFGIRVLSNLNPEELNLRKKEVIENFLENLKFEVDFVLDKKTNGEAPTLCHDLSGYWSYFVKLVLLG